VVKEDLYKKSGHYDNYKDSMFPPMIDEKRGVPLETDELPSHMTLFKEMGIHSYRTCPCALPSSPPSTAMRKPAS